MQVAVFCDIMLEELLKIVVHGVEVGSQEALIVGRCHIIAGFHDRVGFAHK